MAPPSTLLLVVFLAIPRLSLGELRCYFCLGYDPELHDWPIINNPNCVAGSFDKKNVSIVNAAGDDPYCITVTMKGDRTLTYRGPLRYEKQLLREVLGERDRGTLTGYYCNTDLCNTASATSLYIPGFIFLLSLVYILQH